MNKSKKIWLYIICGIVVVVATVLLIVFVLLPRNNNEVKKPQLNLCGTWKVVVSSQFDSVTLIDDQYLVFDDENVKIYRGDLNTPYATSGYSLGNSTYATYKMTLSDISSEYEIDRKTDNVLYFYQNANNYMKVIRYKNTDLSTAIVDSEEIKGKWNIIYRQSNTVYAGDYLLFESGTIRQFKANEAQESSSTAYTIEGRHLKVDAWGKDMIIVPVNSTTIVLVELENDKGAIWELKNS